MSEEHLSLRDAIRFLWHSQVYKSHAESVYHDVRTDTVRCRACGRVWGAR